MRTVRTECLDHLLIVNAHHLERVLRSYVVHYNCHRPHQGIDQKIPARPRPLAAMSTPQANSADPDRRRSRKFVRRHDRLGGLIHEYELAA